MEGTTGAATAKLWALLEWIPQSQLFPGRDICCSRQAGSKENSLG